MILVSAGGAVMIYECVRTEVGRWHQSQVTAGPKQLLSLKPV